MARSRSLPRDFLKDPDVMELANADHRLILVGLVLNADDEGRGLAHNQFLVCELGASYTPEQIELALSDLQVHELVQCYQVGRHRYYHLPRWLEWETLSKPTPSRYPAPPVEQAESISQGETAGDLVALGIPEKPRDVLAEEEGEGKRSGSESEQEDEAEAQSTKVVPIPTAYAVAVTDEAEKLRRTATIIARILQLKVTEDLTHLVREYQAHADISLEGEAYQAREWISDRRRNKHGKRMSVAFFRNWLKRELASLRKQEAEREQLATGTQGAREGGVRPSTTPALRDLSTLGQQYQAAMNKGGQA